MLPFALIKDVTCLFLRVCFSFASPTRSGLSNSLKRPWKLDVEDGNCNMGSPGRSTEILSKGLALGRIAAF